MNYTLSQRLEIQINYYYYCLYNKISRFPACWSSFLNKNYLQNLIFEDEKKKILYYPKRMNYLSVRGEPPVYDLAKNRGE